MTHAQATVIVVPERQFNPATRHEPALHAYTAVAAEERPANVQVSDAKKTSDGNLIDLDPIPEDQFGLHYSEH